MAGALRRLAALVVVPLLGLGWWALGCQPTPPTDASDGVRFETHPRRPGTPLVVVLAPPRGAVVPLVESLRLELGGDYDLSVVAVSGPEDARRVYAELEASPSDVVVLVDNPTIPVYRDWARRRSSPPAAVIVMASAVHELQPTVPNSTGIAFEPPAVRVLAEMRSLLERPIRRAGVIHREHFEAFVARERERAKVERIELVAVQVPSKPTSGDVARGLRSLRRARVDAVWVSNDDALLTPAILSGAWLPFSKRTELPIAVGVPSLVSPQVQFGTFAVVTDVEALGVQVADVVYALADTGYRAERHSVQPPLSTRSYLDVAAARASGVTTARESRVDVLVGVGEAE